MLPLYLIIPGFLACSALIIFSGSKLALYGDIIAEKTGMGKAWFGLIMMGAVTSLPELFTGISSVLLVDSPDIAVGDIMGSCAFNLFILAILDYFVPDKPISSAVTFSHVLAGFLSIFLITLAVIGMVFHDLIPIIGWFSSASILLIIIYIISVRLLFVNEKRNNPAQQKQVTPEADMAISLNQAIKQYAFFASMVIAGAISLPFFANGLAEQSGISQTFIGTLLVAASTSLPELVVSISAVRRGSIDIAMGNLLGSNVFNMLILAIDDLLYSKGSLFTNINPGHALSGMVTLLMTAVVGIGIMQHSPTKRFILGIDAIIIILLYIALVISLFVLT